MIDEPGRVKGEMNAQGVQLYPYPYSTPTPCHRRNCIRRSSLRNCAGSKTSRHQLLMNTFFLDVTFDDFQERVIDASHHTAVLVDFWADWCAPCRVLKPLLEKLAGEYGGRFILAKLNADQNKELVARYGVRGIPAVKAFVDGKVVDEFTGALPEAQIRAFINGLLPSPAEPIRIAAREARARGEPEVACSLLDDALQLDPDNEAAQLDLAELRIDMRHLDAARAILEAREHKARDLARLRALQARLKLRAAGSGVDPEILTGRIADDPNDLDARLQLASCLALAQDYVSALEQLLEIVRRDRHWQDDAARKSMLDLFTLLGSDPQYDDLMREYRIRLARILN